MKSNISFLSTKRSFCIPKGQVIMVCKNRDLHWKPSDRDFYIPDCENPISWVSQAAIPPLQNSTFVTERVSAAECATAAAILLKHKLGHIPNIESLEAIASSAIYADVPCHLSKLLPFSVEQIAIFKRSARSIQDQVSGESGKPRSAWGSAEYEQHFCTLFQKFTLYLYRSTPKQTWESDEDYLGLIESKVFALQPQVRVSSGVMSLDTCGFNWVDPRVIPFLKQDYIAPLVLIRKDHRGSLQSPGRAGYLLSSRYNHPLFSRLDLYDFYDRLSEADDHRWTGSRRIGGSNWHFPSGLAIGQVVEICSKILFEIYGYRQHPALGGETA